MPVSPGPTAPPSTRNGHLPAPAGAPKAGAAGRPDLPAPLPGFVGRERELAALTARLEAQAHLAAELRQPIQRWYTAVVRATRAIFDGRFADGERLIREALRLGGRAQPELAASSATRQTFGLSRLQGRLHELERPVRQLEERFSPAALLALLCAEQGRAPEARGLFEAMAADGFAGVPLVGRWPYTMCLLAEVCASLGDRARGAVLYQRLTPYAGRCAVNWPVECIGAVARPLGLLATTLGRWAAAVRHFEDALALHARMGSRPWLAHTRCDYAALLLDPASDGPSGRSQALALLDEALADARELGMAGLAGRADRLRGGSLAAPWAAPAAPRAGRARPGLDLPDLPERLTPREVDVLRLIAAGRSNQQIADTLVLSVRTVERHIAGLYGKLGASGKPARAVATAYALTHGLTGTVASSLP
jgi:DNA-binding CsgD family transcriptional regulator